MRRPLTPTKPIAMPDARPVASGELVNIRALPAYKARHGLKTVRSEWPAHSPYPILYVDDDPAVAVESGD